jgi:hypothetical protein
MKKKVKVLLHFMGWEIDYALLAFTQLKKSHYYIDKEYANVKIEAVLNCSSHHIDWDKTSLPKKLFIDKFNTLGALLCDYDYKPVIINEGQYGIITAQKDSYEADVDYYINLTQDFYFGETLLSTMIESTKHIKNKYFVVTPEITKKWDHTWDEITSPDYMSIPYTDWDKVDIFDVRNKSKAADQIFSLYPTQRSKWAQWLDLYNKAFYEDFAPIQDGMKGYGAWDLYTLHLTEYAKSKGADFQEYLIRGQVIGEYGTGPLKGKEFGGYYKKYFHVIEGHNTKAQRMYFESNLQNYLNEGVNNLYKKGIIKQ